MTLFNFRHPALPTHGPRMSQQACSKFTENYELKEELGKYALGRAVRHLALWTPALKRELMQMGAGTDIRKGFPSIESVKIKLFF